jgi:hypothetical protein
MIQMTRDGHSLSEAAKTLEIPFATASKWYTSNHEFFKGKHASYINSTLLFWKRVVEEAETLKLV